jgi:serine protease Do
MMAPTENGRIAKAPGGLSTQLSRRLGRMVPIIVLTFCLGVDSALAQRGPNRAPTLRQEQHKNGALTLRAFAPVLQSSQNSVVRFDVDGKPAALGTVISADGLAITKASEISEGTLTCFTGTGTPVEARVIGIDHDNDLGLIKISASGLQPIEWAEEEAFIGQWTVTPGIGGKPEAVGIISVAPRKILAKRALIGVELDDFPDKARVRQVMSGLGAEKAGIQSGDLILAVNGAVVKSRQELLDLLRMFREGQTVKLRVTRESEEFESQVQLMSQPANRQDRMNRMGGEISQRAHGFAQAIQHDTVLLPWQCGGPLVNLEGKAVGLNIARAGRVASYALPPGLVRQLVSDIVAQSEEAVSLQETKGSSH